MQKWKRCAALLCAALLCVALLPVAALADGDVQIDATNFPDEAFREYVGRVCDVDKNDVLSPWEIDRVTSISLNVLSTVSKITSLQGIEHFTALTYLDCGYNALTELDVTKNTALTFLDCGNNALTELAVTKNTALEQLWCHNNALTALDLSNNTQLTTLYSSSQKAAEMHVQRQADGSGRADLSALVPGWSRAQGVQVQGATLEADGSTVVWDGKSSPVTVTYTYQTGYRDMTLDATLNLLFDSGSLPVFTQPAGAQTVTVLEGETGVLSTAATDALVYQWYVNRNDGAGYVAVSGATGATYTTSAATVENDGYTYYCEASNAFGAARSPVFTLRVKAEPASGTDDDSNPEPTPGTDDDNNPEPVPETGDGSRPALWLSLLLLSGAALAAAESGRRRCSR